MTATQTRSAPVFPRIGTGNAQADEILGGGFPANSINIVMGQPGSGKTVFAEQMVFHNAGNGHGDDRPIIYLTTLAEPLAKVVSYLQRFSFYDETKLGTTVLYEDLGAALSEGGVEMLVERVREIITTLSPRMIVIDSFKAVHDLESSESTMRRLIANLAGLLSAYDVTTFLVGEYTEANVPTYPEFAVADGIVEFARQKLSSRDERFFRVLKLRGSAYRAGVHGLHITSDGVEFFPRLVSPDRPEGYRIAFERTPTGVEGLDRLLEGGLWCGSTTLIAGRTGSGKTIIASQFAIEGVRSGEPALYVNFQENPTQLARLIGSLGMSMDAARTRGLHTIYASPVELQIDSIVGTIYRRIRDAGVRRVVVDSVGELHHAAPDMQRLQDYLYALTQHLTSSGVTTVLTFETPTPELGASPGGPARDLGFSYIADNVLILGHPNAYGRRTLRVMKTRNSGHDPREHELLLDERGARIGAPVSEVGT